MKALLGLLFILIPMVESSFGDIHVRLENRQLYMGFDRVQTSEFWLSEEKSYSRAGRRLVIIRKDLGVKWVVDLNRNSYVEVLLDEEILPAEYDDENLQTAGFFYYPHYEWEIRDTGKTEEKNGYLCRVYEAHGDADFAEVESKLWICFEELPGGREYRGFMIDWLLDEHESEPLRNLLIELETGFPVYWGGTEDGPISPVILRSSRLVKLETAPAPPGIYELPEGVSPRR